MKMIKTPSLFKSWQHSNGKVASNGQSDVSAKVQKNQKLWIHPPASLQNGHLAYLVKYFGNVEVNQPKGIEIVKESINKLKLLQPLKSQAGPGNKVPKVELTISVNGVAIQEPKTKKIFCQFPLHRISYCADDKAEKKYFSFIAKDGDSGKQLCFVFMSEKMSEEIILTIGQAFDLAYAKFIENSGKELEIRKQLIMLQKRVNELEDENRTLRQCIEKYEPGFNSKNNCTNEHKNDNNKNKLINDDDSPKETKVSSAPVPALQPPPPVVKKTNNGFNNNNNNELLNLLDCDIELDDKTQTIVNQQSNSIHDLLDQEFDPRAHDTSASHPLSDNKNGQEGAQNITQEKDIFGSQPFEDLSIRDRATLSAPTPTTNGNQTNGNGTASTDPFGMSNFISTNELDSAMISLDKKFAEMRDGFSQGLSAGDFKMDS